jgi:hypothetical protein
MISLARPIALLLVVLLLGACATKYQRRVPGLFAGYEDEPLGERTYQVRVGKGFTSERPKLAKFALYRAAEITKAQGFSSFVILNGSDFTGSTTTVTAVPVWGSAGPHSFAGSAIVPMTVQEQWSYLDIRLLSQDERAQYPNAVDADQVMRDLSVFIEHHRRR